MSENQLITWAATAIVGLATSLVVGRLLNPKAAVVVGPAAALMAHKAFDHRVASELRRALR